MGGGGSKVFKHNGKSIFKTNLGGQAVLETGENVSRGTLRGLSRGFRCKITGFS
jgi:hypothetical protein